MKRPFQMWGGQFCPRTRFPARPSRLESRLAAMLGCPTERHSRNHEPRGVSLRLAMPASLPAFLRKNAGTGAWPAVRIARYAAADRRG
jgi:hypothetical protein